MPGWPVGDFGSGSESAMDESPDLHELGEAARRGLQRAGVHLMKAAIELVAGLSAFLEEMAGADDPDDEASGPEHIEVE